eukprot:gene18906-21507_t
MFSPTPDVTRSNQDADAYSICSTSPLPSPGNSFSTKQHSASFMGSVVSADDTALAGSVRRPRSSRNRHSGMGVGTPMATGEMQKDKISQQIEQFELEQQPLYEQDYLKMREFVPVDIYKTTPGRMIEQGLTPAVAARIWTNKALWLICTHKGDIAKIHLADFRGKYSPENLDVRELRAIWYNLPVWDEQSTNPLEVSKAEWRSGFKSKLDNQVYKMHAGNLPEHLKINPDYEECELKHVFDPTIPLRTRYDRSASMHQHAVASPYDVNTLDNHLRAQPLPHQVAKGTVREKTVAYLSNYDENGDIISEPTLAEDEDYQPMWGDNEDLPQEEEEDYQPNWAEDTTEEVYPYDENDSGLLGRGVDHSRPPPGVAVRGTSKPNSPLRTNSQQQKQPHRRPKAGLVQDFEAEISDLDNDVEEDIEETSSAGRYPATVPSQQASIPRSPLRIPSGSQTYSTTVGAGAGPSSLSSGRVSHGVSSSHSVRSTTSDHSAGAGSYNNNDARSHGSFKYRSPGMSGAGTPTSQSVHAQQQRDYRHNRDPQLHAAIPGAFPREVVSPTRHSTGGSLSPKRESSNSSSRQSVPLTVNTNVSNNVTNSFAGGVSPTPSTQGSAKSPFPVNVSPIPAYVHNPSKSFVPKRTGPITILPSAAASRSPPRNEAGPSQSLMQPDAAYDGANPHGYSARRLEREQARRMRSAEVRAQTESQDYVDHQHSDSEEEHDDDSYEQISPTSSISSHVDEAEGVMVSQVGSNYSAERARTYSPFSGLRDKPLPTITSSEASTERDSIKPAPQTSSSQAPCTPPSNKSFSAPIVSAENHETEAEYVQEEGEDEYFEEGEENGDENEDDESYMSEDDDLSFNTAEEIKTPMLNRHGHRTVQKKHPSRTPHTVRRAVAASKGRHSIAEPIVSEVTAVSEPEPVGVPAASLDLSFMRDNLVSYIEIGDVESASSLLSMAKHASPRIPVESLLDPAQATALMMRLFQDPHSSLQGSVADATLKLLVDKLRANVNSLAEDGTHKSLLHYMVESDRQSLGKLLIVRGADILLEDATGICPLALSLSQKQDWVLTEYQRSGRQDQLLVSTNNDTKLKLATHLIFAGYSQQAGVVIRQGNLQVTPAEASHWLSSCRGNFENMKDPIETFELLESLGAAYED